MPRSSCLGALEGVFTFNVEVRSSVANCQVTYNKPSSYELIYSVSDSYVAQANDSKIFRVEQLVNPSQTDGSAFTVVTGSGEHHAEPKLGSDSESHCQSLGGPLDHYSLYNRGFRVQRAIQV